MMSNLWKAYGCGMGLRSQHYPVIIEKWPKVDWFEAISENYMDSGGRPLQILEQVRHHYPIALHGTALSIGSVDPLNQKYLERLKALVERIDPFIVSDHLCWSGVKGEVLHDLLPLPFTEEAVRHIVRRVNQVQEFLGRKILLENVSTYVTYKHSIMPEWEFLSEVAKRSGCGILLDINNIYVNAINHKFDPSEYLKNIPKEFVGQIHLAGHTDMGDFLFDTHSAPVIERVWELYREALSSLGPVSTLIEWDEHIPPFEQLMEETNKAKAIYNQFTDSSVIARQQSRHGRSNLQVSRLLRRPPGPPRNDAQDLEVSLSEAEAWMKLRIHSPESEQANPTLLQKTFLNPQGGVSGEERMSVYANGYSARIQESLKEVYEAIHHVLGDEPFSELAHAYAGRYPSHDYNLNFVGRHLSEFLSVIARERSDRSNLSLWIASSASSLLAMTLSAFPFLHDLAKLEWLIWEAFHAFDKPAFRADQFAEIPAEDWEGARIVFQPSVSLISSAWPILDIWRARRKDSKAAKPKIAKHPQKILIGRRGDQVRCELLDQNQYELLNGLLSGESLGAICERLAEMTNEETLPISTWFSNWVREGLIVRLEFSNKRTTQRPSFYYSPK